MDSKRILIANNDLQLVKLAKLYLNCDGYAVKIANDGQSALRLAKENHSDLIVLDTALPGIGGLELCRNLYSQFSVPIIITADTNEQEGISGKDLGEDYYITKPFSAKDLAVKIRTILRRIPDEVLRKRPEELYFGDLTVNFYEYEAYLSSKALNLTPIEFRLLSLLVREPHRVFNRTQLVAKVLGYDYNGFDRTVDSHVSNLRGKLENDAKHPKYIKTVYGSGYKFIGGQS